MKEPIRGLREAVISVSPKTVSRACRAIGSGIIVIKINWLKSYKAVRSDGFNNALLSINWFYYALKSQGFLKSIALMSNE